MKVLIKKALIHDIDGSIAHRDTDILIENGQITAVGNNLNHDADHTLAEDGLHVSSGWFDPFVNFCEPGNEHKEDLHSGCAAAIAGGFTAVGVLPDTQPLLDSRPQIDFIERSTEGLGIQVLVGPSFVKEGNHGELSEILELSEAGAFAFNQPEAVSLTDAVVLKALDYSKFTSKKVCLDVTNHSIIPGAFIHEGLVNVKIGLRGIPSFSEVLLVKKYIELLRYTGASLHLSGVSTADSLELISAAKADGLDLTCDCSVYHLLHTDEDLLSFNTNFKLRTPLRSELDRNALVAAVMSGTIDVVTAYHQPHEEDAKKTEITLADSGVIGLQTLYPLLIQAVGLEKAIGILVSRNRTAFNRDVPVIKEGNAVNLTVFNPESAWVLNAESNKSKSNNSMLWNEQVMGSVLATVLGSKFNRA